MFIAMNRFRVAHGAEADFEKVWTSRDSHLGGVPGFIAFHLLRGHPRGRRLITRANSQKERRPARAPPRIVVRSVDGAGLSPD